MKAGLAVIQILLNDANVSAIVSDRVYPNIADEESVLPTITVMTNDIEPSASKSSSSTVDFNSVVVQSNSERKDDLSSLDDAVRAALDRYNGTVTVGSDSVNIENSFFQGYDDFEEKEPNRLVYISEQTYRIRVKRTPDYQL
jgi:hypothetical protein